jgi:hypothetical protein
VIGIFSKEAIKTQDLGKELEGEKKEKLFL